MLCFDGLLFYLIIFVFIYLNAMTFKLTWLNIPNELTSRRAGIVWSDSLPRKEAVQTSLQNQICHWCQLLMCHRSCRSSSRGGSILMSMMLAASLRKLILLSAIWEINPLNDKPLKHWSKPEPRHPSATRASSSSGRRTLCLRRHWTIRLAHWRCINVECDHEDSLI